MCDGGTVVRRRRRSDGAGGAAGAPRRPLPPRRPRLPRRVAHRRLLPRPLRAGDGRHGLHGQGAGGEAAALLPRPRHHLPAHAAQARPGRALAPRPALGRHAVRLAAARAAGRAQQGGAGGRRPDAARAGHQRRRPAHPGGQRVRRLPRRRHRQVRREAQALRRHERAGHESAGAAVPQDVEAGGAAPRVHRLLQLPPVGRGGARVPAARRPRPDRAVRRLDGRGPHRLHHAQDRGRPAQHVHVHQGAGGARAGVAGRQPARRHRAPLHRDGVVARAAAGLGGQPQRPHGAAGGRRQGPAAHHVLLPRPRRRRRARRHRHQPAARRRVAHRRQQAERDRGVQLHVGHDEPAQVGRHRDAGPRVRAQDPLQRHRVVPGRQLQEQPRAERRVPRGAASGAGLRAGRRRAPRRPQAHHGAHPPEDVEGRGLPGVLHDARVALPQPQRARAVGAAGAGRAPALPLRRARRGVARLLRGVRARHALLHPQGGPGLAARRAQADAQDVRPARGGARGCVAGAGPAAASALASHAARLLRAVGAGGASRTLPLARVATGHLRATAANPPPPQGQTLRHPTYAYKQQEASGAVGTPLRDCIENGVLPEARNLFTITLQSSIVRFS